MITESSNTLIAILAMFRPGRLNNTATWAQFAKITLCIQRFLQDLLSERVLRDHARVRSKQLCVNHDNVEVTQHAKDCQHGILRDSRKYHKVQRKRRHSPRRVIESSPDIRLDITRERINDIFLQKVPSNHHQNHI